MHTISRVKRVEDAKWDYQPKGFNNNIRWHAGHLFMTIESFVQQAIPSYEPVNSEWVKWFDDGTSPKDWTEEVPAGEEILAALREQLDWIIPVISDKLDATMDEPLIIGNDIMTIDSNDGLVQFLAWHEGVHAGVIYSLNNLELNSEAVHN